MTHDGDNGSARKFNVVGVRSDQFFKLFFCDHLLKWNEGHFVAEAFAQVNGYVVVQRLIDGCENTALKKKRHNVLRLDAELFSELFDGRTFYKAHRFQFARDSSNVNAKATRNAIFERKSFWRRQVVAVKASALAALMRFLPARGVSSASTRTATTTIRRRRDVCYLRRGRFARSPASLCTS